jgi:hypothetical protein
MNANRSEVAPTPSEPTNTRSRSAEGIYKAKAKPGFDSENPGSTNLFAYICTYLRTFALKPSSSLRGTSTIPAKATSCISVRRTPRPCSRRRTTRGSVHARWGLARLWPRSSPRHVVTRLPVNAMRYQTIYNSNAIRREPTSDSRRVATHAAGANAVNGTG